MNKFIEFYILFTEYKMIIIISKEGDKFEFDEGYMIKHYRYFYNYYKYEMKSNDTFIFDQFSSYTIQMLQDHIKNPNQDLINYVRKCLSNVKFLEEHIDNPKIDKIYDLLKLLNYIKDDKVSIFIYQGGCTSMKYN